MQRNQLERWAYVKPAISVCALQTESFLHASGQHQEAEHGGPIGNAKQGWFDEEEEEESLTPSPSPEGEGSYQSWNE